MQVTLNPFIFYFNVVPAGHAYIRASVSTHVIADLYASGD
jgi:hypothetical protein